MPTDLETFKCLLSKTNASIRVSSPGDEDHDFGAEIVSKQCQFRVRVFPGYRCHFEAEFDASGNILNIGQWDEM